MRDTYDTAATITGMFVFVVMWGYLVASEGFLLGVTLGWIPSLVCAMLGYMIAPAIWLFAGILVTGVISGVL